MKALLACLFILPLLAVAQKRVPLPHGMVFGTKPEVVNLHKASELDAYMGRQTRTSAVIIATLLKVTNPKQGWFDLDAGQGHVIHAHFQQYNVSLPIELKGRQVIVAGVAARQFLSSNGQHLTGRNSGSMHNTQAQTGGEITFEATGLYVNK